MGFLDNSGDIILDAVLTDTGRMRLAKGDGTFRIAKFALGDDEINYESYNKNHPSGSAYFDLEVLQTPVFEAFTNNTSNLKSRLVSIARTNLLYLPIIKLNTTQSAAPTDVHDDYGVHVVLVDEETENASSLSAKPGILAGFTTDEGGQIQVDQGLDTTEIPQTFAIDNDLTETQYIIEMDNRLGQLLTPNARGVNVSFIDDDNIASYYVSQGTSNDMITAIGAAERTESSISGPRGTRLNFKIKSSIELQTSTFLFTQLGGTDTNFDGGGPGLIPSIYYIDSTIRITGATTGYRLDVPVRFVKKQ